MKLLPLLIFLLSCQQPSIDVYHHVEDTEEGRVFVGKQIMVVKDNVLEVNRE